MFKIKKKHYISPLVSEMLVPRKVFSLIFSHLIQLTKFCTFLSVSVRIIFEATVQVHVQDSYTLLDRFTKYLFYAFFQSFEFVCLCTLYIVAARCTLCSFLFCLQKRGILRFSLSTLQVRMRWDLRVASLLKSSRGIWRAGGSYGKLIFHLFILLFKLLQYALNILCSLLLESSQYLMGFNSIIDDKQAALQSPLTLHSHLLSPKLLP